MRKFLIPIINLVNIILVSIAYGLSVNPAINDAAYDRTFGNYYQLVWQAADKVNVIGIIGFFLFVVATALMLVNFIPFKGRKFVAVATGAMFVASGVLMILTPSGVGYNAVKPESTGSFTAMVALIFVAGVLTIVMSALDFTAKKEK